MLVHSSRTILPGGDEVSCGEADEVSELPVWAILEVYVGLFPSRDVFVPSTPMSSLNVVAVFMYIAFVVCHLCDRSPSLCRIHPTVQS